MRIIGGTTPVTTVETPHLDQSQARWAVSGVVAARRAIASNWDERGERDIGRGSRAE
jgi:hypothetical protein